MHKASKAVAQWNRDVRCQELIHLATKVEHSRQMVANFYFVSLLTVNVREVFAVVSDQLKALQNRVQDHLFVLVIFVIVFDFVVQLLEQHIFVIVKSKCMETIDFNIVVGIPKILEFDEFFFHDEL